MNLDPSTFRQPLLALYHELDAEINRLGPKCDLSGRCCRFAEYGHTLFLSAPEAALLVADASPPSRAVDDGASCPWQDFRGHCTAREARPIGCRVYFCDPNYQTHAPELSETFIGRLKTLVDKFALPWNYAPLHRHLQEIVESGWSPEDSCSELVSGGQRSHDEPE